MSLGHDKISSFSDEEDSTISGPFTEEVEGHTDSYRKHLTRHLSNTSRRPPGSSPSVQKIYASPTSIMTDTCVFFWKVPSGENLIKNFQ
jgi:hypothetical protein